MISMVSNRDSASRFSPTDDVRWEAVVRRDRSVDGSFFYSVRTTGVYCRPSCAARQARRENVEFHTTVADAERAGFRPCKRCHPDEAAWAERHAIAVAKACRMIEEADEVPPLDVLANAVDMSRFHFHRVFKQGACKTSSRDRPPSPKRFTARAFSRTGASMRHPRSCSA